LSSRAGSTHTYIMTTNAFTALLGEKLQLNGTELVNTATALAGKKTVGLYFSAHWCPPCRGFTPQLVAKYDKHYKAKGMEIIFVSSDRDEESFKEYYGTMPWLALPFDQRELKAKLSKRFKVQGIPSFVVLDGETGETITTDGRECVDEDPEGNDLPWKPPSFWDALGSEFLKGTDGETVGVEELKGEGKYIGLYFSAHWCPPCRKFTPALVDAYTSHLKAKSLEVIFVSSDRDQASFVDYFSSMPWLAIPQGDPRKGKLSKRFGVSGIPSFVIVDAATGETINGSARGKVSADPKGDEFPWHPKPLNDMVAEGPGDINEETTLCAMMEGCEAATSAAARAVLEQVAAEYKAKGEEITFLYAAETGGPTAQIRQLTKLGEPTAAPQLCLIDIPDEGGFYVSPATEITRDTVTAFLAAYKSGGLERQQLG